MGNSFSNVDFSMPGVVSQGSFRVGGIHKTTWSICQSQSATFWTMRAIRSFNDWPSFDPRKGSLWTKSLAMTGLVGRVPCPGVRCGTWDVASRIFGLLSMEFWNWDWVKVGELMIFTDWIFICKNPSNFLSPKKRGKKNPPNWMVPLRGATGTVTETSFGSWFNPSAEAQNWDGARRSWSYSFPLQKPWLNRGFKHIWDLFNSRGMGFLYVWESALNQLT